MFSLKAGSKNTRIVVFFKHLSIQTTHKIFTRDFPPPYPKLFFFFNDNIASSGLSIRWVCHADCFNLLGKIEDQKITKFALFKAITVIYLSVFPKKKVTMIHL